MLIVNDVTQAGPLTFIYCTFFLLCQDEFEHNSLNTTNIFKFYKLTDRLKHGVMKYAVTPTLSPMALTIPHRDWHKYVFPIHLAMAHTPTASTLLSV